MGCSFSYRRWLTPDLIIQEAELLQLMNQVRLSQEKDTPRCKWSKNGKFTVKSVYKHLCKMGWKDLLGTYGKARFLFRSKFGCG
jgi:hypothetical protein